MKVKLVNIVLTAILVVSMFFVIIQTSSSGEYDPWIDSNDDGEIDIFDAINLASAFGTSGTPINKTALLLELQARIDALNSTVIELQAQATCVVESGEFDGEVSADMVEDSGANIVFNFQNPFVTAEKPGMVVVVVLKYAADGLTEGSAIRVVEDIKGAAGNWTGFDLTVSKYSGGSISDTTQVYVTWIAIGALSLMESALVVEDIVLVENAGNFEIPADYNVADTGILKIEYLPNLVNKLGGTTQAHVESFVKHLTIEVEAYADSSMSTFSGPCWTVAGALSEEGGKARWDLEFKNADGSSYSTTDWKLLKVTTYLK